MARPLDCRHHAVCADCDIAVCVLRCNHPCTEPTRCVRFHRLNDASNKSSVLWPLRLKTGPLLAAPNSDVGGCHLRSKSAGCGRCARRKTDPPKPSVIANITHHGRPLRDCCPLVFGRVLGGVRHEPLHGLTQTCVDAPTPSQSEKNVTTTHRRQHAPAAK